MSDYIADCGKMAGKIVQLREERDELREALAKITSQWPAAFDCLAPSFRHMSSGDQVATVNAFDQAIIAGAHTLANLNKPVSGE